MDSPTVFTLGHGNRSLAECIALLTEHSIEALVDVRADPHSSRFPHFSAEPLRQAMEQAGIVYHWAGRQLGGRRPMLEDSPHTKLDPDLRGYADYMQTDAFRKAATQLINMAGKTPLALLCAERLPERCHRRLIADYLVLAGIHVVHLIDTGKACDHLLSAEARRETTQLVYDRQPVQ
jgi:uncharacterized protein (DUF488 family)